MIAESSLGARARLWARFFARISYPRDVRLVLHAFARRGRFQVPTGIWNQIEPLDGFLSAKEAGLLCWAATHWPVPGPVLELGSYAGRSTIVFARSGRQVHAVDAWSLEVADLSAYGGGAVPADVVYQRMLDSLRRAHVSDRVTLHCGLTQVLGRDWLIPGAILYVDAGHLYADVKRDLDLWTTHLQPGGLLLMHDVLGDVYLDVTRAASELLQQDWRVVASAGSIVAFTRNR